MLQWGYDWSIVGWLKVNHASRKVRTGGRPARGNRLIQTGRGLVLIQTSLRVLEKGRPVRWLVRRQGIVSGRRHWRPRLRNGLQMPPGT